MSIGHRVIFERDITQTELPWDYGAAVAQGTHNPLVVGSNPSGPIFILDNLPFGEGYFFYFIDWLKDFSSPFIKDIACRSDSNETISEESNFS